MYQPGDDDEPDNEHVNHACDPVHVRRSFCAPGCEQTCSIHHELNSEAEELRFKTHPVRLRCQIRYIAKFQLRTNAQNLHHNTNFGSIQIFLVF